MAVNSPKIKTFAQWVHDMEDHLDPYMDFDMYIACLTYKDQSYPDRVCSWQCTRDEFDLLWQVMYSALRHGQIAEKLKRK